jgi:hypothetical protein
MDYQKKEIEIKNLDHLGIVAGLIDEIGNNQLQIRHRRERKNFIGNSGQSDFNQWIRIRLKTFLIFVV